MKEEINRFYAAARQAIIWEGSTKKLAAIISEETLIFYILFLSIEHPKFKKLPELEKIEKALSSLKGQEIINDSGIETINKTILKQLEDTREGLGYLQSSIIAKARKTKKKNTRHPFIYTSIVGLVNAIKRKTDKPRYELLAACLSEQGLTLDSETIKKIYRQCKDMKPPDCQVYCTIGDEAITGKIKP